MNIKLLDKEILPDWFSYPENFLRIVDQGLLDFDPWIILTGDRLNSRYEGIKSRYPDRQVIPFAMKDGTDDVACWEINSGDTISIIHDYASSGWESREQFDDFWEWLRNAVEETILYDGE